MLLGAAIHARRPADRVAHAMQGLSQRPVHGRRLTCAAPRGIASPSVRAPRTGDSLLEPRFPRQDLYICCRAPETCWAQNTSTCPRTFCTQCVRLCSGIRPHGAVLSVFAHLASELMHLCAHLRPWHPRRRFLAATAQPGSACRMSRPFYWQRTCCRLVFAAPCPRLHLASFTTRHLSAVAPNLAADTGASSALAGWSAWTCAIELSAANLAFVHRHVRARTIVHLASDTRYRGLPRFSRPRRRGTIDETDQEVLAGSLILPSRRARRDTAPPQRAQRAALPKYGYESNAELRTMPKLHLPSHSGFFSGPFIQHRPPISAKMGHDMCSLFS
jgi:hypothetical protein